MLLRGRSDLDPRRLVQNRRSAITEARDILRFEPFIEAPLSEGFPKPAPVGELHVQNYPKYRVARADLTLIEGRVFWTLFNHIKQREIAMTAASMEMVYAPGQRRRDQQILDILPLSQHEPGTTRSRRQSHGSRCSGSASG